MTKQEKTLGMRVLEGQGIAYEPIYFPDTVHDAVEVAQHAGVARDDLS